jgi:hypothetical protein
MDDKTPIARQRAASRFFARRPVLLAALTVLLGTHLNAVRWDGGPHTIFHPPDVAANVVLCEYGWPLAAFRQRGDYYCSLSFVEKSVPRHWEIEATGVCVNVTILAAMVAAAASWGMRFKARAVPRQFRLRTLLFVPVVVGLVCVAAPPTLAALHVDSSHIAAAALMTTIVMVASWFA